MKTCPELVKSDVAERCSSTYPATNHPFGMSKGVAAMQSIEQWRPVVGFEGFYEVSDRGQVRSIDRNILVSCGHQRCYRGKLLKPKYTNKGYPVVNLRGTDKTIHRLVLEAFIGPPPVGFVACHNNDIPTDNRLENLRWDSRSENQYDIVRNGNHAMANKTHCKRGHEFTPENTRIRKNDSGRECRACDRTRSAQRLEENPEHRREISRRSDARRRAARKAAN